MFNQYLYFTLGEEPYVADVGSILTSNPPQYNVQSMKTGKRGYMFCSEVKMATNIRYISKEDYDRFIANLSGEYEYGG